MTRRDTGAEARRVPRLIEQVADLRRRLGTRHPVHRTMVAHDVALSSAAVPDGAEVVLDGELESISEGVVLTGTVTAPWSGECRRCLRSTSGVLEADVREIFETRPTEGDTWPLHADQIVDGLSEYSITSWTEAAGPWWLCPNRGSQRAAGP